MEEELIATVRSRLYSGVLSDVLDSLGHKVHAMSPRIRPLDDGLVMFGRARTARYTSTFHFDPRTNPYDLEIKLVDSLAPGEVPVLACPPGDRITPWGELLSTAANARGAAGAVTDGLVRDVRLIRQTAFPVFAGGIGPLDSKGRGVAVALDVPVECGGVPVRSGDWIFGAVDGVVVLPVDMAEEAVALALDKVKRETTVREELSAGESLATVFARHQIL